VRDVQGGCFNYEGTVEDITQRRQAEENVRNSEALYHSLVETLPQNIFARICKAALPSPIPNFGKMLGRTREEICR